ncbi:MAG: hypothetical protein AABZ09_05145, partial [Candidatus Binatota bacterium]
KTCVQIFLYQLPNGVAIRLNNHAAFYRRMFSQLCSFDDIQYHLYVREKVERSLRDLKSKRVLSQKEVERWMTKWLGK